MNTPNRDMIRDVIRLERETPSYNKCLLPGLFEDIIKQLWPLRESVAIVKTSVVSDHYIDFDTID